MFTGIVEGMGVVRAVDWVAGQIKLRVEAEFDLAATGAGDSIAVSGTCLTVVEIVGRTLSVHLAPETIERTTLARLRAGDAVNLERAVAVGSRLGGHVVQGHVDAVGRVVRRDVEGDASWLEIEAPEALGRYIVEKGSIAVDGVSLTVARGWGSRFRACVIPYTLAVTTLGRVRPGDGVNLEADILAKYVERLLAAHRQEAPSPALAEAAAPAGEGPSRRGGRPGGGR